MRMKKRLKPEIKNLQYPHKIEYEVSITVLDIKDNSFGLSANNEPWEYTFNSADMLENRRNAIRCYIDISNYFLNSGEFDLISPADLRNIPHIQGHGISIWLEFFYDECTLLFDKSDPEVLLEILTTEAYILSSTKNVEFIMVSDLDGNKHTVLKEDFELFNTLFNASLAKIVSTN